MRTFFSAALIAAFFGLIVASCSKGSSNPTTPPVDSSTVCNPSFYAYSARCLDTGYGPYTRWQYGSFNLTGATINMQDSLKMPGYNNQGTYNSHTYCYYIFTDSVGIPVLLRIDNSGVVTRKPLATNTLARFEALVYNSYSNKMYALKKGITFTDTFVVINEGTSDFTTTNIVQTPPGATRLASSTVNQVDGALFLAMNYIAPMSYKLFAYTPGTTVLNQIASGNNQFLLGIRHNKQDKQLYGIQQTLATNGSYLVKMNATTGAQTAADTLGFDIDRDRYSVCLDVCDNKFIISTTKMIGGLWDTAQTAVYQVNATTAGGMQYTDKTGIIMGLEVRY